MMIQPGMALVFANDCGANCATTFTCDGCGCCEVSTSTEKCCCCGGGSDDHASGSCCMGSTEPESSAFDHDTALSETLTLKVIVINTADSVVMNELATAEMVSGCQCGIESQPLGDSSPMRPTIQQRDVVAARFADLATIFGDAVPRVPRNVGSEESISPPHFSQIHLCIWRL
ncbi:membrane or secreted protein [Novipirellula sp. SH528]|uniref:membrane or secreted protein n=1 Tax=Novipirellula sp. SH528 TaxID=3454466 RepID=UPI003F9FB646